MRQNTNLSSLQIIFACFFTENLSRESSSLLPRPSLNFGATLINRAMRFIQNVAGVADEANQEQIRKLQEDLKKMLQKCKSLELEQSTSKVSRVIVKL